MRKSSLDKVAALLDTADRPLELAEIMEATHMSAPTVNVALALLGAVSDGEWPRGWSKPRPLIDTLPSIASDNAEAVVIVPIKEITEDWTTTWNRSVENVSRGVAELVIDKKANPKILADRLRTFASITASLTLALDEVKEDPDWFAQLSAK